MQLHEQTRDERRIEHLVCCCIPNSSCTEAGNGAASGSGSPSTFSTLVASTNARVCDVTGTDRRRDGDAAAYHHSSRLLVLPPSWLVLLLLLLTPKVEMSASTPDSQLAVASFLIYTRVRTEGRRPPNARRKSFHVCVAFSPFFE